VSVVSIPRPWIGALGKGEWPVPPSVRGKRYAQFPVGTCRVSEITAAAVTGPLVTVRTVTGPRDGTL